MSLVHFKKVEIYTLQTQRADLIKLLQDLAVVEIVQLLEAESVPNDSGEVNGSLFHEELARLDNRIAAIGRGLNFLERTVPVKPNLMQQFAGVKTVLLAKEQTRLLHKSSRLEELLTSLQHLEQDLIQIQHRRNQLSASRHHLQPWEQLDLNHQDLSGSAQIEIILGAAESNLDAWRLVASQLKVPVRWEAINESPTFSQLVLFGERRFHDLIHSALTTAQIGIVVLPELKTTVAAALGEIKIELGHLEKAEQTLKLKLVRLAQTERPLMQVFFDSLTNEHHRVEVSAQLLHGQHSCAVNGWVPETKLPILKEKLAKADLQQVMVVGDPTPEDKPPVAFKNNQLVSPFEYLVQSFSYPQSHEVDPTPAIAPFFFIFFGMAVGDAGYGTILALFCAGLLLTIKLGPVGRKLSWMFLFSGIGAIIFGLFTGSVLSLPNLKFGVFNPLQNPILLLVIALGLGLVQLYLGVIISAWENIKAARWGDVLWNQGFWLLFLTSVLLVLGKDWLGWSAQAKLLNYLLLCAALGVVIGNARGKKGVAAKLLALPGGLFTIYGSIGFFSDLLSYSRLMALGLSSGVMGSIINQLAGMAWKSMPVLGWFGGALIFLLGHGLNLALSVLGAYVHSSRLQYLEFFGKFFEGGGKPFAPFKPKTKYTLIINEEEV